MLSLYKSFGIQRSGSRSISCCICKSKIAFYEICKSHNYLINHKKTSNNSSKIPSIKYIWCRPAKIRREKYILKSMQCCSFHEQVGHMLTLSSVIVHDLAQGVPLMTFLLFCLRCMPFISFCFMEVNLVIFGLGWVVYSF